MTWVINFKKGNVRTRMGSKDELLRMIAVLHANGIEVIQDVVPNQMGGAGDWSTGGLDPAAAANNKYKNLGTPVLQNRQQHKLMLLILLQNI